METQTSPAAQGKPPPQGAVAAAEPSVDTEDGLRSQSPKIREETLSQLRGNQAPAVVQLVDSIALTDPNANVRKAAVIALGAIGRSIEVLEKCLGREDEQGFIRVAAATSLGALADDRAIPALSHAANSTDDRKLQEACVRATWDIGTPAAADALAEMIPRLSVGYIQAMAVTALGKIGSEEHVAVLTDCAHGKDDQVRKAAATAIGALQPENAGELLAALLVDPDAGVRSRAAKILRTVSGDTAVPVLARAVLCDVDVDVRAEAAASMATFPPTPTLVSAFLKELDAYPNDRARLDGTNIATALAPATQQGLGNGRTLAHALMEAALDADERHTGLIAEVLLVCCDRNSSAAGELINGYERSFPDAGTRLTRLRVELGGKDALDPILDQLRTDLETYFQIPVHQLNESTRDSWQQAIDRARQGFLVRMIMSIVVFGIGVVLVLASAAQFLFGDLDTTAAWGAGGTLASGLAAMLVVTYTGPLKDIRQSINDLGIATVSFIGYVHEVLEISHTFTALYLRDRISFDELEKSGRLLRAATADAVKSFGGSGSSDSAPH